MSSSITPTPGLLARLRARLPARLTPQAKPARDTVPPALDLTEEEIAAIQYARFLKLVGQEGETVALWREIRATKDEIRAQVRRATLILAALLMGIAVVLAVLPSLL
jgi:hypothetical protein